MMKKYLFCLFSALFAVSATAYELKRVGLYGPLEDGYKRQCCKQCGFRDPSSKESKERWR